MTRDQIERGIAAYARERAVFLRLLRKRKSFNEREFDTWFGLARWKRRTRARHYSGDTFILGMDRFGHSKRNEMLELLQIMVRLGEVVTSTKNGLVVYRRAA